MVGYLNRPEATAKVLRDGWYSTGDLGLVDPDGFLRITDRLSRFSKIAGEMVPHVTIESAIMEITGVDEHHVAVTGVPDPKHGEKLCVLYTDLGMSPAEVASAAHGRAAAEALDPLGRATSSTSTQIPITRDRKDRPRGPCAIAAMGTPRSRPDQPRVAGLERSAKGGDPRIGRRMDGPDPTSRSGRRAGDRRRVVRLLDRSARRRIPARGFIPGGKSSKNGVVLSKSRENPMAVVIRVTSGPHSGQEYLIDRRQAFMVGRSSRVHFPMTRDMLLSREHFRIENQPPLCHLVDLGSTNGTKVNGLRVERVLLREGDVITAGDSSFVVQFCRDRPATASCRRPARGAASGCPIEDASRTWTATPSRRPSRAQA